MKAYVRMEALGEGTYGKVFRGEEKATSRIVALKLIKDLSGTRDGVPCTAIREMAALKGSCHQLRSRPHRHRTTSLFRFPHHVAFLVPVPVPADLTHPNIVQLLDVVIDMDADGGHAMHLVFEYIPQDLKKYMETHPGMSMDRIKVRVHVRCLLEATCLRRCGRCEHPM
jgi:serine/threonine protein kinase